MPLLWSAVFAGKRRFLLLRFKKNTVFLKIACKNAHFHLKKGTNHRHFHRRLSKNPDFMRVFRRQTEVPYGQDKKMKPTLPSPALIFWKGMKFLKPISKAEGQALIKMYPQYVCRTQHKRHYFIEESRAAMRILAEYRSKQPKPYITYPDWEVPLWTIWILDVQLGATWPLGPTL